jgi:translation initiation factor 2 alpha subunit (eIF-2alpha)
VSRELWEQRATEEEYAAMSDTKIDTEEINGTVYDIFVDSVGQFHAMFEDDVVRDITKKGLIDKLRRLVKTQHKVRIEATLLETSWHDDRRWQLHSVTLTGIHGRNRNVTYLIDGKRGGQQYSNNSNEEMLKRLSPAERTQLSELWQARVKANKAYQTFLEAMKINAEEAVEAEMKRLSS